MQFNYLYQRVAGPECQHAQSLHPHPHHRCQATAVQLFANSVAANLSQLCSAYSPAHHSHLLYPSFTADTVAARASLPAADSSC